MVEFSEQPVNQKNYKVQTEIIILDVIRIKEQNNKLTKEERYFN